MQYNINPDGQGEEYPVNPSNQPRSSQSSAGSSHNEESDVLRSLVKQARGMPIDVQRITGPQVKALRTTTRKEAGAGVAVTRVFAGFFGGIFSALGGMFAPPRPKNTQCKIYGHTRPTGKWEGLYPKCIHCGIEIKSDEMLKGSMPKPS